MSTLPEGEVTLDLFELTGSCPFVADGDKGQRILRDTIVPLLKEGKVVILLCDRIENMNDQFANAFFGPLTTQWVAEGRVKFKGCSELVKFFIRSAFEMELRAIERRKERGLT